jgi:hypothetical protein
MKNWLSWLSDFHSFAFGKCLAVEMTTWFEFFMDVHLKHIQLCNWVYDWSFSWQVHLGSIWLWDQLYDKSFMDYVAIDRLPDWIFLLQYFEANSNTVTSKWPQLLPFMCFLIQLSYDFAIYHLRWHDFRWYSTSVILILGLTSLIVVL